MNSKREIPMPRLTSLAGALAAAVLVMSGCELDVENPNAPDANRAFQDPAGLEQLLGGAFRTWVEARSGYYTMPMTAMADNYTASWNNAALRFYSSVGSDCPQRCGWTNSATAPEAAGGGGPIESQWYGYNTVLSSANDVLGAIGDGLCFDDDCADDNTQTSRNKAIAKMLQGMAFAGLALVYDSAFALDEGADLSKIRETPFSSRAAVRDSALAKFDQAYAEAGSKNWSTPGEWMGVGSGTPYTSQQIRQTIRTMQAELIALWPRNAAENAQADWAKVAQYAAQGVSSGSAFDWEFYIDIDSRECGIECVKTWGNSIGTMRVDTRVAALITTNHKHPWPDPDGNPCPTVSNDKRVGDGSWGPEDDFNGYATLEETANAGTDFACTGVAIFPPARGQYHQSNLQHIRYNNLAYRGENLPDYDGTGQDPFYTRQMNDLLWAEGLIRSGGSLAQAATLINNSRFGRGGLTPVAAGSGSAALLAALQYEQEIEFMGQGPTAFFNRRRIDGLQPGTPRHMPVPARELDVLLREIYSFGGPGKPDMSVVGNRWTDGGSSRGVRSVREIWRDYQSMARAAATRLRQ